MKKGILILLIFVTGLVDFSFGQNFDYTFSVGQSNYSILNQNDSVISDSAFWDSNTKKVPLGFAFSFGGVSFDEINVRSNGVLSFDDNNSYSIVAFLKNFNFVFDTTNTLLSKVKSGLHTNSVTGNLIFKIEFSEVSYLTANGKNVTVNFQIWLNQNTNTIEFHFGPNTLGSDIDSCIVGFFDLNVNDGLGLNQFLSGNPVSPQLISSSNITGTILSNIPSSGFVYVFSPN